MNNDVELQQLNYVRDAVTLDQAMWQLDLVDSGRVGLVRSRQVNDYVRTEATVEFDNDDPSQPRFLVRGVVINCYDPVREQVVHCTSAIEAAEAAVTMLRWVSRAGSAVAAEISGQCTRQNP